MDGMGKDLNLNLGLVLGFDERIFGLCNEG